MSILDIDALIQDNTIQIHEWLKENLTAGQYKFLKEYDNIKVENNIINVKGSINIVNWRGDLPEYIRFGEVTGNFVCISCEMTSLKGVPECVGGSFDCSHNQLSSLEYGPKYVRGSYYAYSNNLINILPSHNLPKDVVLINVGHNEKLEDISGLAGVNTSSLYIRDCGDVTGAEYIKHIQFIFSNGSSKLTEELKKYNKDYE